MLTMIFAVADTMSGPHTQRHARACRGHPRLGSATIEKDVGGREEKDVDGRAQASEATPLFERLCPAMTLLQALLRLGAAADFELLALVLHLRDGAEHLEAELAVRLAVDLHGALVLHHVAGRRIDRDMATRPVGRPALERRHDLLAV